MTYYDEIAEGYEELHREEQLKKLGLIKESMDKLGWKLEPGIRLLDVGCGTGLTTDFWDCDTTGIDPSQKLLDKNKGGKSEFVLARAEEIPFPDKSFDYVVSVTAIQNFDDTEKGLREIERVGRGRYVLSYLKRSGKADRIEELIDRIFKVISRMEEEKDIIFLAERIR